jgi:hypothetical protein
VLPGVESDGTLPSNLGFKLVKTVPSACSFVHVDPVRAKVKDGRLYRKGVGRQTFWEMHVDRQGDRQTETEFNTARYDFACWYRICTRRRACTCPWLSCAPLLGACPLLVRCTWVGKCSGRMCAHPTANTRIQVHVQRHANCHAGPLHEYTITH